jgi:nucleotide-binding universal stress UspA family protein
MIINNADSVVLYDDAWTLIAEGAKCGEKIDRTTTPDNATQVDGVALPTYWTGGSHTWTEADGFVVANQDLVTAAKKAVVPATITPLQIRLVLSAQGLRDDAEAIVAATETPQSIKDSWEYATIVERNNADLLAMAAILGLTDDQIDDLFIQAVSLT